MGTAAATARSSGKSGKSVPQRTWGDMLTDDLHEDGYEVEALLDRKKSRGKKEDGFRKGTWLYKCLWKGYPVEEASWQAARDVANDLIQAYEEENNSPRSTDTEESGHEEANDMERQRMSLSKRQDLHRHLFGSEDSDFPEGEAVDSD